MKTMNKKAYGGILGVVILIVILVFAFNIFGTGSAFNIQELTCAKAGTNYWDCSNFKGSVSIGSEGKASFRITKPSSVSEWNSLYFATAKDISPNLKDFLSTHTDLGFPWGQPSDSLGIYSPYDKENKWDTKLPGLAVEQNFNNFGWDMKTAVSSNIIKTQFVIIEGIFNDKCPSGGSPAHSTAVKTYGLCNGRDCWVYDNFPDRGYEKWSNAGALDTCGLFEVRSIKVYSKDGGYTEELGKKEFGFTPEEIKEIEEGIPESQKDTGDTTDNTQAGENSTDTPVSFMDKINNSIQSVIDWFIGLFK
jgi:hypothetical protein